MLTWRMVQEPLVGLEWLRKRQNSGCECTKERVRVFVLVIQGLTLELWATNFYFSPLEVIAALVFRTNSHLMRGLNITASTLGLRKLLWIKHDGRCMSWVGAFLEVLVEQVVTIILFRAARTSVGPITILIYNNITFPLSAFACGPSCCRLPQTLDRSACTCKVSLQCACAGGSSS
jgi:hypothetical protein